MRHYLLQPEVGGGLGPETVLDRNDETSQVVSTFHCQLDGWLGDDLIECFPCFLVTEKLADALAKGPLTGFELAEVEISSSEKYAKIDPGFRLPKFRWLKINGRPHKDDFWIENDQSLAGSTRAWETLKKFQLQHCGIREERD